MTRKEWYDAKNNDRAETFGSSGKRNGAAETAARIERKARLNYGVAENGEPVDHRQVIEKAIADGKQIPDEVLADYPDLKESGIALLSPSLGRVDANKVDIAVASKVVADLLSGWRNAPDSRVVATFDDLPAAVRKEIEDQGEKTARGVFHGDTFYLIADEHASANEIEETIFHEVWAHYGLRSMLGANTTRELAGVFDQISASGIMGVNGKDAFRAFARRNGFNTAQTESMLRKAEAFDPRFTEAMKKRILVEELIAKVQEKGDNPSLKRKAQEIIGAIREWLRKVGFSGLMKYSDADLMRLVQKARDTVKYGKRGSSGKGDVPSVLMTAWHGSPHDHDKFDSSKIGTGEGAQAYGYGHYFAGAKDVAEWYRRKLSGADNSSITFNGKQYGDSDAANRKLTNDVKKWAEETGRDPERIDVALEYLAGMAGDLGSARQLAAKEGLGISHWIYGTLNDLSEHLYPSPNGRLYQVELAPTADEYLDWDKPLSEQSEFVRNALTDKSHFIGEYLSDTLEIAKNNGVDFNERGDTLYKIVSDQYGSDKAASDYLHSIGIRGIRYLDGSSRSAGEGNSNYVIFNDADVSITAKYNKASKDKLTPADTAIYGMAAEGKSAAEVLKFIASASRSPFNRQVAKLLMKTGIAPSVTVGDGKGWKMNAGEGNKYAAGYNPKSDTISLFRPASAERHVLHELMHAATLKALNQKGMAAGQMKALFAHVEKVGRAQGLFYDKATGRGVYGMADIDEFVAEAFTNPKFQEALKKVSAQKSSGTLSTAWNWFVRVVRGILGIPQGQENALSQALEIGVEVMREDMALRKSEGGASAYTERMAKDNLDPDDAEAMRVQKAIEGKSTIDVAQWISVSGSPSERMIAGKVLSRLKMLESAGVNLKFKVAHVGDSIPRSLLGARGITTYKFGKADPSVDVWINGADVTGKVGTSVRTVLHELVHAATMGAVRLGGLKVAAGSKLAADVADLYAVTNSIIGHFNRRVADSKAGKITLTDFEQRMFNSENNAFRDVHETLAWALTDVDAQSYLESIPYQSKSAWTSFVSAIRQFLGLSSSADTALSEVLRVSEAIMSDNINDMIAMSNITGTAMATQESSDQMILSDHHGSDAIRYATGPKQTDSAAFRKWFGDSKVVDANGDPLVVYHGTGATDISEFKVSTSGTYGGGIYLTPEIRGANDYAIYRGAPSSTVYPVYAAIKNPASGSEAAQVASWKGEENAREELIRRGYDGVVDMRSGEIVAFYPEQIKSAIGNNGDFDPNNQDIRYNVADEGGDIGRIVGDSGRQYDQRQRQFFKNVGRDVAPKNLMERTKEYLQNDFWKKMAVGIVDQFRGLRDLNDNGQAYMLARLSKGTAGAFETLLHHGKLSLKDGVYDGDQSGGFIEKLGVPLHGELDDFLWWVAANRAEGLAKNERENLFTPEDIAAGKSLASGETTFDYTIQTGPGKGKTTRSRAVMFSDAQRVFNEFQKNTLDMAEQSGLIDGASRKFWESEFYVPFYRVSEEDGEFIGAKMGKSLVRQQAFKKLKGGTDKLNSDLLSNTLLNWSHLIEASAKNRAAKASLVAAEQVGAAHKAEPGEKKTVWFMDNGQKIEYVVTDPFVMTAITSLEYAGMRNGIMDVMTKFKHWLTIGVTASPAFKVRNLIRDSIQAIGTSDLGYNPAGNIGEGYAITDGKTATKNFAKSLVGMAQEKRKFSQAYVSALSSGGLIRFGTMLEGKESDRIRQLIKTGVKDSSILDSESKWRAFYDKHIEPAINAYNELGNVSEEINRASLYDQMIKNGVSHADAALAARDLMDFSMQGSFNTIRFLTQIVPFMNARLQGMYKLGRSAKDNPRKLAIVTGAVALASIALMLGYEDDDDWKRREDWDRDNFWWFKFGGIEYRIPKPFEVGAVGTLAERSMEYMLNDEMTGERFRKVVGSLVSNNLSMNPIPQVFKPMLDLYANKDSFTGRPIESMGMQRLDPTMRYNSGTSLVARGLSSATLGALSPVQYDHLTRAYFGWLGAFVVGGADMATRVVSNEPTQPAMDYWKFATQGIAREEGTGSSRYVTMIYDQAKELEQAHATYRRLLKDGKIDDAKEYSADHADELLRYRQVERVKKIETQFNERIHSIERSDLDSGEKRVRIERINKMKENAAKRLAPGYGMWPPV